MSTDHASDETPPSLSNVEFRLEALERAIAAYIYEAHEQTLRDVAICDHDADICWCNYNSALEHLMQALRR